MRKLIGGLIGTEMWPEWESFTVCSKTIGSCRRDVCGDARYTWSIVYTMRMKKKDTNLGLSRWRMVPRIASKTKRDAAATYAQPKNGFFPPIHETVEMTMDFVPE